MELISEAPDRKEHLANFRKQLVILHPPVIIGFKRGVFAHSGSDYSKEGQRTYAKA